MLFAVCAWDGQLWTVRPLPVSGTFQWRSHPVNLPPPPSEGPGHPASQPDEATRAAEAPKGRHCVSEMKRQAAHSLQF